MNHSAARAVRQFDYPTVKAGIETRQQAGSWTAQRKVHAINNDFRPMLLVRQPPVAVDSHVVAHDALLTQPSDFLDLEQVPNRVFRPRLVVAEMQPAIDATDYAAENETDIRFPVHGIHNPGILRHGKSLQKGRIEALRTQEVTGMRITSFPARSLDRQHAPHMHARTTRSAGTDPLKADTHLHGTPILSPQVLPEVC